MIETLSLPSRGRDIKIILLVVLILEIIFSIHITSTVRAYETINGIIVDKNGNPINEAKVIIWLKKELMATYTTSKDGYFEFDDLEQKKYTLYTYADDNSTPGFDYLPARVKVNNFNGSGLVLSLQPGGSFILDGEIQFFESGYLPYTVKYTVIDSLSDDIKELNGFPLVFGAGTGSINHILNIEENHILVPVGEPFKVEVNCSVLIKSDVVNRSFSIDKSSNFIISKGQRRVEDVRTYSVPFNIEIGESLVNRLEEKLNEMERLGFYTVSERKFTTSATKLLLEAKNLHKEKKFVESFDSGKKGYLTAQQTLNQLVAMYKDASISIYSIIIFFSFVSTSLAFLIIDRNLMKIFGSIGIYYGCLMLLYKIYPGSTIIPLDIFVNISIVAISSSLILAMILPRIMKGRGKRGHVPVRNIVIPIFSIAKRSIKRRRLRFILTTISITVFVMSFISLTSFSESYGILVSKVSSTKVTPHGVLIRSKGFSDIEPVFLSNINATLSWLNNQPESIVVSPKAENIALPMPLMKLGNNEIWGIIGINPKLEISIVELEAALIDGKLPSKNEVVISKKLQNILGVNLGDTISIGGWKLSLQGIFDDKSIEKLKEFDGSIYISKKLVNINPEGEQPNIVVKSCEASEILLLHISDATKMASVDISRISITVKNGTDVNNYAERLALEGGFWVWSSSNNGTFFTRLGNYLEGQGFPLIVPWLIVVFNVVVTVLNSMYERQKEIHVFSSIGLNPAQIAAIFIAEASMIGLIAGGFGYLTGLSFYKMVNYIGIALNVKQKISAFWSIASITISMIAVLIGAGTALRRSTIITPSLMRRWRLEFKDRNFDTPWEITVPVRLMKNEVERFIEFVVKTLKELEDHPVKMTTGIKVKKELEKGLTLIEFIYKSPQTTVGTFYTKNTLIIQSDPLKEVKVKLNSYGEQGWAHETGTLIRMITMRWSTYVK